MFPTIDVSNTTHQPGARLPCEPRRVILINVARGIFPSPTTKCTSNLSRFSLSLSFWHLYSALRPPSDAHLIMLYLSAHLDPLPSSRRCHDAVAFSSSAIASASVMVSWPYDSILSHASRLALSHRRGTRATGRPTATHKRQ